MVNFEAFNALTKVCDNKVQKSPVYVSVFISIIITKNAKYSKME